MYTDFRCGEQSAVANVPGECSALGRFLPGFSIVISSRLSKTRVRRRQVGAGKPVSRKKRAVSRALRSRLTAHIFIRGGVPQEHVNSFLTGCLLCGWIPSHAPGPSTSGATRVGRMLVEILVTSVWNGSRPLSRRHGHFYQGTIFQFECFRDSHGGLRRQRFVCVPVGIIHDELR